MTPVSARVPLSLILACLFTLSMTGLAEVRTEEELEREYRELKEMEAALTARYGELRRKGLDSFSVLQKVHEQMEAIPPEVRARLAGRKLGAPLEPELQTRFGPIIEYLKQANAEMQGFQEAYDGFTNRKMDYFMSRYDSLVESFYNDVRAKLKPKDQAELDAVRKRMLENRDTYHTKEKAFFGSPADRQRLVPYIMFFVEMDNLMKTANRLTAPPEERARLDRQATVAKWKDNASMALALPRLLYSLYQNYGTVDAISPYIERKVRGNGMQYEVRGLENRPPTSKDPNNVNVYVPLHAHLELDVPSISKLGLDNYVLFVSKTLPDFLKGVMGVPEWFTNRLEQSRQVLWVEHAGRNPITDLLGRIEKEGVRNVVATAEANLPNGVTYSTRPIQENFGNGTVELLRRKGKNVTIVPVTMSGNFRIREDFQGPETKTYDGRVLPVTIHKPISADVVDLMAATGVKGLLNHVIRQQWLDQMHEDFKGERIVGMPVLDSLQPALDHKIFEGKNCRDMWARLNVPSPVSRVAVARQ